MHRHRELLLFVSCCTVTPNTPLVHQFIKESFAEQIKDYNK